MNNTSGSVLRNPGDKQPNYKLRQVAAGAGMLAVGATLFFAAKGVINGEGQSYAESLGDMKTRTVNIPPSEEHGKTLETAIVENNPGLAPRISEEDKEHYEAMVAEVEGPDGVVQPGPVEIPVDPNYQAGE